MDTPEVQIPMYQSHKKVAAAKITEIKRDRDTRGPDEETDGTAILVLGEIGGQIKVNADFMHRHKPEIGGYYVRYSDGYESWSPGQAFEEGYTRL